MARMGNAQACQKRFRSVRTQILDKANRTGQQGINLMLPGFVVMVQKARSNSMLPRGQNFSITPKEQEQSPSAKTRLARNVVGRRGARYKMVE